jgi:capsular polysaccharide transport system ATP-binding protein
MTEIDTQAIITQPENVKKISVCNVYKSYKTVFRWKKIFKGITFDIPSNRNLGILGRNGTGKSTLMQIISGLTLPDRGEVRYNELRVSWPLGRAAFQGSLSAIANLKFVCRIYDYDFDKAFAFVEDFSELGEYLYMPIGTYSAGMKARLAFACSMALECFDTYLIDEGFNAGDARFSERVKEVFQHRLQNRNIVCVSHSGSIIKKFCDYAAILDKGDITFYEDIDEALAVYQKL